MTKIPIRTRRAAERGGPVLDEFCVRLGIEELTIDTLTTASRPVIGPMRTALRTEAIRDHRLSRAATGNSVPG